MNILNKGVNDLKTTHPDLASEFHPIKNGNLFADDIMHGSRKKIWWLGKCGHEWEAVVYNRACSNSGCPYCDGKIPVTGETDLASQYPDIAAEWHPTKNGDLKPCHVTCGSYKKVWWLGKCGHEWCVNVGSRVRQHSGCPVCDNKYVVVGFNDLTTSDPELVKEWHPTKNGNIRPYDVTSGSSKKVWWLGKCGHEWKAVIEARSKRGDACPYCSNQKVLVGFNDLQTKYPEIAKQWHPTKNEKLKPTDVTDGSSRRVWWLYPYDDPVTGKHFDFEWKSAIEYRTRNNSKPPFLSSNALWSGFNDLETLRPHIAKYWHPTKNGDLKPSMVTVGSVKKVWWTCEFGHEFKTSVQTKCRSVVCPICNKEHRKSFPEVSVYYYIKMFYPDAISNDFKVLEGKELDIYIPSKHVGIEYDGSYYHQNLDRDIKKDEVCRNKGISLIRIREKGNGDWKSDYSIIFEYEYGDWIRLSGIITKVLSDLCVETDIVDVNRDRMEIYSKYVISVKDNSLGRRCSDIAKELHPELNGSLTADMISYGSGIKVWWRCRYGHVWEETVNRRTSVHKGCPMCQCSLKYRDVMPKIRKRKKIKGRNMVYRALGNISINEKYPLPYHVYSFGA